MRKGNKLCITFFNICLFIFPSCGLDVVYYLNAPMVTHNTPDYTTKYDNEYFEFTTNNDQTDSEDFEFLGTAVYYKIYNNYSTMQSNISTLSSLSSSTNESAAATKMIESFGYKQIGTSNGSKMPLISADSNGNQRIYIRLTNYQEIASSDYVATIKYRKSSDSNAPWTIIGVPLRTGNRYTFDFGRKEDSVKDELKIKGIKNTIPSQDDVSTTGDVIYSSSFSDEDKEKWYVDMYAVAVGQDNSFTQYYSNILHLGSVCIDSSVEDN